MYLCFVAVMFASCGDDTEDCSAGLYGDDCENRLQDLYIGTWSGDDCDGDPYSIVISAGDTAEDIVILNGGLEIQGKATYIFLKKVFITSGIRKIYRHFEDFGF